MSAKSFCNSANAPGIVDARRWAAFLVSRECRGAGDHANAMHRLETRYGIPWRVFWTMQYRPPHDILLSVYLRLWSAYQYECDRQRKLIEHDQDIARAKLATGSTHGA